MRGARVAASILFLAWPAGAQPVAPARGETVLLPRDWSPAALQDFKALSPGDRPADIVLAPNPAANLGNINGQAGSSSAPANVLVLPAASPAAAQASPAVAVSSERLRAAALETRDRLLGESINNPSFLVRLSGELKDVRLPAITTPTAEQAAVQPAESRTLGANETVAAAILRAQAAGFDVRIAELDLLPAGAGRPTSPKLVSFNAQLQTTLNSFSVAIKAPSPVNRTHFTQNAIQTRNDFEKLWPVLRNDPRARSEAVRKLGSLMEQSSLKTIYGLRSNFPTSTYQRIFLQSQRVVGIARSGEVICTGYVVSPEWVVTAGHCLVGLDTTSIRVSLTVGEPPVKRLVMVDDLWPSDGRGRDSADDIDYAFLHLVADDATRAALAKLDASTAVEIRTDPVDYEEPVIVVAHRGEEAMKVHDHAYVWFPFRLGPERFRKVSAETGAKLQRLAEANWPDSPTQQLKFFEENMQEFEASYLPVTGATVREYRMQRPGYGRRPYFGMDTDTFHGNSGAPVFSRHDVRLIGVFNGGYLDNARVANGTWWQHEYGMPISEIIADLRSLDPGADAPSPAHAAARRALLAILPQ